MAKRNFRHAGRSIRLSDKDESAKYGTSLLMPGTPEHAAYLAERGVVNDETETDEPLASDGRVTHTADDDGNWKVFVDGTAVAEGFGETGLHKAIANHERALIIEDAGPRADELLSLTAKELRSKADDIGLDGLQRSKKADIVAAILEHESEA